LQPIANLSFSIVILLFYKFVFQSISRSSRLVNQHLQKSCKRWFTNRKRRGINNHNLKKGEQPPKTADRSPIGLLHSKGGSIMTIEAKLERIATALEALVSSELKEPAKTKEPTKTKEPAKTKEPESEVPDLPSLDDVIKVLSAFMKKEGRDAALALLKKYGGTRASDIAEEDRAAFMKEAS
jgi:hypothetical protein